MNLQDIKSERTKKSLANSLKKLMNKKSLSKITINDIVKDSKVNRNTFYYHFEDINSLIKWMFQEETFDFLKTLDLNADLETAVNFAMDYVESNRHILNCAVDSLGEKVMKVFFYDDLIALVENIVNSAEERLNISVASDFKMYICDFYTEALASNLLNYFKNKENLDRQKVIDYISLIFRNSIPFTLLEANKKLNID